MQEEKVNRKWKGIKEHGNQVKLKMHSTNEMTVSLSFGQFLNDIAILIRKNTHYRNNICMYVCMSYRQTLVNTYIYMYMHACVRAVFCLAVDAPFYIEGCKTSQT